MFRCVRHACSGDHTPMLCCAYLVFICHIATYHWFQHIFPFLFSFNYTVTEYECNTYVWNALIGLYNLIKGNLYTYVTYFIFDILNDFTSKISGGHYHGCPPFINIGGTCDRRSLWDRGTCDMSTLSHTCRDRSPWGKLTENKMSLDDVWK